MEAAAKKIKKLAPVANEGDSKKFLQEALNELKEGQRIIAERQKCIRIADQSGYYWRTVEAYKVGGWATTMKTPRESRRQREMFPCRLIGIKKPTRERRVQPLPPVLPQWAHGVPQLP